jgi:sec-independent protein translocase protein TatA
MFGGKVDELIIILLIIMLLFGAKKIPELARSIGQAGREVKKGFSGDEEIKSQTSKSKSSK